MPAAITKLKLNYPPEIAEYIADQLATGRFENESELLTAAVEVFREVDARHRDLRRQVQLSLEQVARGEVAPLDIAEIKAELALEWDAAQRSA